MHCACARPVQSGGGWSDFSRRYRPFNWSAIAPQSSNSCSFMLGLSDTEGRAHQKKLSITDITS